MTKGNSMDFPTMKPNDVNEIRLMMWSEWDYVVIG